MHPLSYAYLEVSAFSPRQFLAEANTYIIRNSQLYLQLRDRAEGDGSRAASQRLCFSDSAAEEDQRHLIQEATILCSDPSLPANSCRAFGNAVRVRYYDLQAYLDTFVGLDHSVLSTISGNIIVDTTPLPSASMDPVVDILLAITICRNAPNLRLRRGILGCPCCGSCTDESALDALFAIRKHAKLGHYFSAAVTAVELQCPSRLTMKIRPNIGSLGCINGPVVPFAARRVRSWRLGRTRLDCRRWVT